MDTIVIAKRLKRPPMPGAGRPAGTVAASTALARQMREELINYVHKHYLPLLEAKLDLALGHYVKEINEKDGSVKIYQKSPDGNAIQYLLNQTFGKPTENVNLKGDGENPIKVDVMHLLQKSYGEQNNDDRPRLT